MSKSKLVRCDGCDVSGLPTKYTLHTSNSSTIWERYNYLKENILDKDGYKLLSIKYLTQNHAIVRRTIILMSYPS